MTPTTISPDKQGQWAGIMGVLFQLDFRKATDFPTHVLDVPGSNGGAASGLTVTI